MTGSASTAALPEIRPARTTQARGAWTRSPLLPTVCRKVIIVPTSNQFRWMMLIAASVVMLIIGTIYSWAVFTEPLLALFHWDLTTTTLAFAIANFCLAAVGTVCGGFWQDRAGPRKVAVAGVSLWGLGNCLAGLGTPLFGCGKTFATMFIVQAATLLLLSQAHDLTHALAGISVVLLCCGGGFGTMPSYNAQYFGTRYMGLNYALVLSAWGFAGLIGPTLLARMKDLTGSYVAILPTIAVLLSVSAILPFLTRKPAAMIASRGT